MTWCILPLLFPPFPSWKICTTATSIGHGGLWCSLGRQHPGLSEGTGGTFWAADPSPWRGASQRNPAVRACQPASQPPYQPTTSMAAGGDAGKWCQHAGKPIPSHFQQPTYKTMCLPPAYLSKETISCSLLPSEQAHSTVMFAHGHCFSSLVGLNNLSVQFLCDLGHLLTLSVPTVLTVVQ